MTTKNEALEEIKQFILDKKEEYSQEADEDFMQWSEGFEQEFHEDYEICTKEGNEVLKRHGDIVSLLEDVENFLLDK